MIHVPYFSSPQETYVITVLLPIIEEATFDHGVEMVTAKSLSSVEIFFQ